MFEFTVHITGWGILATLGGAVVLGFLWRLFWFLWVVFRWDKL